MMKIKDYLWEKEKGYRYLLFIAIAILVGISIFEALRNNNYFLLGSLKKLNNDDVRYFNTAQILLDKHELYYYGVRTAFIMPLFPLFLSGIMSIFGTGDSALTAIRIAQAILQGISLYFIYLIARELFNKKIAIVAAFLFALYLPEAMAPNLILTEVLFQLLFVLMFYFAIVGIKENKSIYYVLTSVFWALTCLTRPNAAIFPLFIVIFWFVNKYKWKDMLKYTLIAFVTFSIFFAPWWIRNINLKGHFILFTDSSANPKLLGSFIDHNLPSFWNEIPAKDGTLKYDEHVFMTNKQQNDLANYIIKTGFKTQPLKYATWYTLGKTYTLYNEPYYWRPILNVNFQTMECIQIGYMLLGILGIILTILNRNKKNIMLLVLLVMSTVIYWPFVTFSRYGFPNMFMIIILASYGLTQICSWIKAIYNRKKY
ncbi:MAG: glycosyltransferase family 39 protein [Sarcina sp.]